MMMVLILSQVSTAAGESPSPDVGVHRSEKVARVYISDFLINIKCLKDEFSEVSFETA
jgi:hypothetical protein